MRVIAGIDDPRVVEQILRRLGAWHAQPPTFCAPHRGNRPAGDPEIRENFPLTPPPSLW